MTAFAEGLSDYRYFKNRGYPYKSVLKIIGDRYRLSKLQRNCLFRGVIETDACVKTRQKTVRPEDLDAETLGIDWFNVIITVESYLKGYPVFLSDDGIVRDSSGVHGSYTTSDITVRAIDEIIKSLNELRISKFEAFIDSPISHSGDIAGDLRTSALKDSRKPFDIHVVRSADYPLKTYEGIVASSDTIVIEHSNSVLDLARYVLAKRFNYDPPELEGLSI